MLYTLTNFLQGSPWVFVLFIVVCEFLVRTNLSNIDVREKTTYDPDGMGEQKDHYTNDELKKKRRGWRSFYIMVLVLLVVLTLIAP